MSMLYNRGWDDRMASQIQWTWVWARTGKPGVLYSWGHKESDTTEWLNNNNNDKLTVGCNLGYRSPWIGLQKIAAAKWSKSAYMWSLRLLPNESGPTAHCLQNQSLQMLIGRKSAFNQNVSNLARWWMQRPWETTFEDSAQLWKVFKGNREVISVTHRDGRSESSPSPPAHRLVDFLWFFL